MQAALWRGLQQTAQVLDPQADVIRVPVSVKPQRGEKAPSMMKWNWHQQTSNVWRTVIMMMVPDADVRPELLARQFANSTLATFRRTIFG